MKNRILKGLFTLMVILSYTTAFAKGGNTGEQEEVTWDNTITVTTTAGDNSTGSFRWAIEQANAATGSSLINFNITGTGPHIITYTGSGIYQTYITASKSIFIDGGDPALDPIIQIDCQLSRNTLFSPSLILFEGTDAKINGITFICSGTYDLFSLLRFNSPTAFEISNCEFIINTDAEFVILGADGGGSIANIHDNNFEQTVGWSNMLFLQNNYFAQVKSNKFNGTFDITINYSSCEVVSNVFTNTNYLGISNNATPPRLVSKNVFIDVSGPFSISGSISKTAPYNLSVINNMITGYSDPNDVIEIYKTDVSSTNFYYYTTVQADASGYWETSAVSMSNYEWFAFTATSTSNVTSDFTKFYVYGLTVDYNWVITKTTDPDPAECYANINNPDYQHANSLRWVLMNIKNTPAGTTHNIVFDIQDIPAPGPYEIVLNYDLGYGNRVDELYHQINMDGTTQTGYNGQDPIIIINGNDNAYQFQRLMAGSDGSTFKGLKIKNFLAYTFELPEAGNITIEDNVIHDNTEYYYETYCIRIFTNNNIIRNNIIYNIGGGDEANFATAVDIRGSNNVLYGNIIGTDRSLTQNLPINGQAISIVGVDNRIGTTDPSQQNIISNSGEAISVAYDPAGTYGTVSEGNKISGNLIYNNGYGIGNGLYGNTPVITNVDQATGTITGTSLPGCTIELFRSTGFQNANEYITSTSSDGSGNWTVSGLSIASGEMFVVTSTDPDNNTSEFSFLGIEGNTYNWVVTKTTDPDPTECAANLSNPGYEYANTLRWVMQNIQNSPAGTVHNVMFDIQDVPAPGPYEIQLNYEGGFTIDHQVTIDGTTQSGYNGQDPIIIVTDNAINSFGFIAGSEGSVIRGLELNSFFYTSIGISGVDNITVKSNVIHNMNDYYYEVFGIEITNANNNIIINNVIYDIGTLNTGGISIRIVKGDSNEFYGNIIGTDRSLTNNLGGAAGIDIFGSYNILGSTTPGMGNIITNCIGIETYYDPDGALGYDAYANRFSGNLVYNTNKGIFVYNHNNPPVITNVDMATGIIAGTSLPNSTIEVFRSTGPLNANEYVATASPIISDAGGNWSVSGITIASGEMFVVTATGPDNTTSEFSYPGIEGNTYNWIVTKTTDPNPTECAANLNNSGYEYANTLRWVMQNIENSPAGTEHNVIFDIQDVSGPAPYTINLTSYTLPVFTRKVIIDGSTQTPNGYTGNEPKIAINGNNYLQYGLYFQPGSENSLVNDICIYNFTQWAIVDRADGIEISNNTIHTITAGGPSIDLRASNCTVKNNYIGTNRAEDDGLGVVSGIGIHEGTTCSGNIIGTTPNEGNVIKNCGVHGIGIFESSGSLQCISNLFSGNRIFNIGLTYSGAKAISIEGSQNGWPPYITSVNSLTGTVSGRTDPDGIVELFSSEARQFANDYLATTTADANGDWSVTGLTIAAGDMFSATVTRDINHTSELSEPGCEFTYTFICNDADLTVCEGQSISFTATGGDSYKFIEDEYYTKQTGASGSFSYTPEAGEHAVYVIITHGECVLTSNEIEITVLAKPSVTLDPIPDVCPSEVYGPLTQGSPSGGTYSGTCITNPSAGEYYFDAKLYDHEGDNTVTYTYEDANGCPGSDTYDVTILPAPVPALTSNPTNRIACVGGEISFTCTTTADNYNFYINDVSVQSGTNNTYTSSSWTNNDKVKVEVTYSNSCTNQSAEQTVTIMPALNGGLTFNPGLDVCDGDNIIITSNETSTSYTYTFNINGVDKPGSANNSYTYEPENGDDVYVTVTAAPPGCYTQGPVYTITVHDPPTVTLVPFPDVCQNELYGPLTQGSGSPAGGTGTYSGTTIVELTTGVFYIDGSKLAAPGLDGITYEYADPYGCVNDDGANVEILASPAPQLTANPSDMITCPGGTYTFTCSTTADLYQYNLNGSAIPGAISNQYTTTSLVNGDRISITNTYTYPDKTCTHTSNEKTAIVWTALSGNLSFNPGQALCDETTLTVTANETRGTNYDFYLNGGTTPVKSGSERFYSYDPQDGDDINVVIENEYHSGCQVNGSSYEITVYPLPVVSFTGLDTRYCTNSSSDLLTGSPSGGTFSGPGIQGNYFVPSAAGAGYHAIIYTYQDANGCENSCTTYTTVYNIPNFDVDILSYQDCSGEDGSAQLININAGINPIYAWSESNSTTSTANNLTGDGTVTVTHQFSGCSNTKDVLIENRMLTIAVPHNIPCDDAISMESLELTVYSRFEPFTYDYTHTWHILGSPTTVSGNDVTSDVPGNSNLSGVGGTGPIQVVFNARKDGCDREKEGLDVITYTAYLTNPTYSPAVNKTVDKCMHEVELSVNRNVAGNLSYNYDFTYPDNSTKQVYAQFSNTYRLELAKLGDYYVDIHDNIYGCDYEDYMFNIPPQNFLTIEPLSIKPAACGNPGEVSMKIVGGYPEFSFTWLYSDNAAFTSPVTLDFASYRQNTLDPGWYKVQVSDDGGCYAESDPFEITEIPDVEITGAENNGPCEASVSFVGGTPPYTIKMKKRLILISYQSATVNVTSSPAIISDLKNGTYDIEVTDKNGCTDTYEGLYINTTEYARTITIRSQYSLETDPPPPPPIVINRPTYKDDELNGDEDKTAKLIYHLYEEACLDPEKISDELSIEYGEQFEHYTLYYYDRAGNLVATAPPRAVQNFDNQDRDSVPDHMDPSTDIHNLVTHYEYNSLGNLIRQTTPDAGLSRFIYDDIGRLRFSQNSEQARSSVNTFSYTVYDKLSRIIEVGECSLTTLGLTFDELQDLLDNNREYRPDLGCSQRVYTIYTEPGNGINYHGQAQRFITNRVSYTYTDDGVYSYYSYDPHGNVEWLVVDIPGMGQQNVRYEYDLISGNVLKVAYNEYRPDAFYHQYEYDDDNRIIAVYTSRDGDIWDRDAHYDYYKHGPLQRAELGEDYLQGLDYAYTINGWLKAINHPEQGTATTTPQDFGGDGIGSSMYVKDVFSMSLGYFPGDYMNNDDNNVGDYHSYATEDNALYNGNISSWTTTINHGKGGSYDNVPTGRLYAYDRLNRIKSSDFYSRTSGTDFTLPSGQPAYATGYKYDPNGNIMELTRNGYTNATGNEMDSLAYDYDISDNKLHRVTEKLAVEEQLNGRGDDLTGVYDYTYDNTGNLVSESHTWDDNEGHIITDITNITWNVYGKVKEVERADKGEKISYIYDPAGNRVSKAVEKRDPVTEALIEHKTTYYVRDASGNIMSVYERYETPEGTNGSYEIRKVVYDLKEQPLYGSQRLGMLRPDLTVQPAKYDNNVLPGSLSDISYSMKDEEISTSLPDYIAPYERINLTGSKRITTGFTTVETTGGDAVALGNLRIKTTNFRINGGSATGLNEDGEIQFYVASGKFISGTIDPENNYLVVVDKAGNLMTGTTGILIAQDDRPVVMKAPGKKYLYYIFSRDEDMIPAVTTVDMSLRGNGTVTNPLGALVDKVLPIDDMEVGAHSLTIEDKRERGRYILYLTTYEEPSGGEPRGKTRFVKYIIDEEGIGDGVLQPGYISNTDVSGIADMKFSPDATRLAIYQPVGEHSIGHYNTEILLIDVTPDINLDLASQRVLYTKVTNMARAALEFDQSGQYICFSSKYSPDGETTTKRVDRINMAGGLYGYYPGMYGNITRGENGLMLVSDEVSTELYTINTVTNEVIPYTSTLREYKGILNRAPLAMMDNSEKPEEYTASRVIGRKQYELNDHLGNIRAVITDRKLAEQDGASILYYAQVEGYNNYYPFGALLPGFKQGSENYRFGYNGKEMDNDFSDGTTGAVYDYGFRIYDPRIARFLSIDPLTKNYPMLTPYQYASNRPIDGIDLDGLEFLSDEHGSNIFRVAPAIGIPTEEDLIISTEGMQMLSSVGVVEMDQLPHPGQPDGSTLHEQPGTVTNWLPLLVNGKKINTKPLAVNTKVTNQTGVKVLDFVLEVFNNYQMFKEAYSPEGKMKREIATHAMALKKAVTLISNAQKYKNIPEALSGNKNFISHLTNFVSDGTLPDLSLEDGITVQYRDLVAHWGNMLYMNQTKVNNGTFLSPDIKPAYECVQINKTLDRNNVPTEFYAPTLNVENDALKALQDWVNTGVKVPGSETTMSKGN